MKTLEQLKHQFKKINYKILYTSLLFIVMDCLSIYFICKKDYFCFLACVLLYSIQNIFILLETKGKK